MPSPVAGRTRARRVVTVALAFLALGATVAACGDDSSSTASSAANGGTTSGAGGSGRQSVCTARSELSDSVDALKSVDVTAQGTNGLSAAITSVRQALSDLDAAAHAQFGDQVSDIRSSLSDLSDSATQSDQSGLGSRLADLGKALAQVETATKNLGSELSDSSC